MPENNPTAKKTIEFEYLTPNEKKALEPCISVEILCDGVIHYRRPSNHPHTLECAYLIATGKAPSYSINEISGEHEWNKERFEESGSWLYYFECVKCGLILNSHSYNTVKKINEEKTGSNVC